MIGAACPAAGRDELDVRFVDGTSAFREDGARDIGFRKRIDGGGILGIGVGLLPLDC